jgi:large subunit ribosomal protein L2
MNNKIGKLLKKGIKHKTGRNNNGRIVVQGRTSKHKHYFRYIFYNMNPYKGYIVKIEKDPIRSSYINLVNLSAYWFFFLPKIYIYKLTINSDFIGKLTYNYKSRNLNITTLRFIGDSFFILDFDKNNLICNLYNALHRKSNIAKSSGTFCKLIKREYKTNKLIIELPSKQVIKLSLKIYGTLGRIAKLKTFKFKYKKAGFSNWVGLKSKVRGIAKNPVDHPHGGGNGKGKGRIGVTPYGLITKGKKTRKNK